MKYKLESPLQPNQHSSLNVWISGAQKLYNHNLQFMTLFQAWLTVFGFLLKKIFFYF